MQLPIPGPLPSLGIVRALLIAQLFAEIVPRADEGRQEVHVVAGFDTGKTAESVFPELDSAAEGAEEGGFGGGVGVAVPDEVGFAVGEDGEGPGLVAGGVEGAVGVGGAAVVESKVGGLRVRKIGEAEDGWDGTVEVGVEG